MQQPIILPHGAQDGRRAYGYEYNIQATEDHEDEARDEAAKISNRLPLRRIGQLPNYKPTPLRWPFILTLAALLCVAIGLIAYAEKRMPNSDTDAQILGLNPTVLQPSKLRRFARAVNNTSIAPSTTAPSTTVPTITDAPTSAGSTSAAGAGSAAITAEGGSLSSLGVSSATDAASSSAPRTSESSSSSETAPSRSPPVRVAESSTPSTGASETRAAGSDTILVHGNTGTTSSPTTRTHSTTSLPSGATLIPLATVILSAPTNVTLPASTITFVSSITTVHVITVRPTGLVSTVASFVPTRTFQSFFSQNGTIGSSAVSTAFTNRPFFTLTRTFTGTDDEPDVITVTDVYATTGTVTVAPTIIPTYGPVTVTYYQTVIPPPDPVTVEQPSNPEGPAGTVETTVVDVVDGSTATIVHSQAPVVLVVPTQNVVTQVTNQVETGVTTIGGAVVTNVLVITPAPGVPVIRVSTVGGTPVTVVQQQDPVTVETEEGGVLRTVVQTPPPRTIVSIVGGTATTISDFVAPVAPGQPVTYTVVSDVGGTPVTQVVVTTPTGPPFQPISYTTTRFVGGTPTVVTLTPPPTTFVTTINGTPVTSVTTPPVTSFTTTIGGTATTEIVVITPTGGQPITLTFVSTSGGTLSTYTSTLSPTTFVTTISGVLTTITSTPSPSTGFSTRPKSTRTFTSTSTPTSASGATAFPTVIASTRVFDWGPADLFLGTFLPPLVGIVLVILLRIVDLNAKLYQPFQSLARDGGASGAESLTMQYTGLMAFITPMVTLLQGHPVPFITTMMVGCASFIVPLATEAIGLKLHGSCYLNTADARCGPALGISPVPADVLMGLIGVVIILLLLVLFFMTRWVTGVNANPWNLAGIASLAGSAQARIGQSSEQAMKRSVSQKQYGLGYFQNALGREEYGIILTDESGRGLQEHGDADSDPKGFDGDVTTTTRAGSGTLLPFMPLRYPWRIVMILFHLMILIFVIYYHIYYHGRISDGGRLWAFMNTNSFGVRFVSAAIGVVIAFCWQSFFLSVSIMTPYQLMARRTQPAARSILFSPSTNPFSGIYAAVKHRHLFLFATSFAGILSEFLPLLLSNVPFSLSQPYIAASLCAIMSSVFLSVLISVLVASFFVRYPPMPVDPRSIAGAMYYVSQSHMLGDFDGMSQLDGKERDRRVKELGRRYFYGVLAGGTWRRMGVDYDLGPSDAVVTAYSGARRDDAPAVDAFDEREI